MDADLLAGILAMSEPKKVREIELTITARLRRRKNSPVFVALGRQLDELQGRHRQGQMTGIELLTHLLELAREVVEAEKGVDPREAQEADKAALAGLFNEVRGNNTPARVRRIVNDIDAVVRIVRFRGWQQSIDGERAIKKALRKTLLKYKLQHEQELFDRAYEHIKEYY